jgi:hypothetical protein
MATFVRTQEIEHEIGPTGRFALRVTTSDVELREARGGIARVRIEFDIRAGTDGEADEIFERVRYRVSADPGVLKVAEPKQTDVGLGAIVRLLGGGGGRAGARVVAEVPPQATVGFNGVSAELVATGLTGPQEYRTVSGDMVLSDAAGEITIHSVSGDVSLRGVEPTVLHANSVSGDLTAYAPSFGRTRVVTVSGDIELEGELADGGEHRIETVSGDLSLGAVAGMTLEVRGLSTDVDVSLPHRSEGSRDRRRYVIGQGGPLVAFSSMSGDVSVGPARRFESRLSAPRPTVPPPPPTAPAPPAPPAVSEREQLAILRALEDGEIDVDEATRRLAGASNDG